MSKKIKVKHGDILLLKNGRFVLANFLEDNQLIGIPMDREGDIYHLDKAIIHKNLGNSPEVTMYFHATRSIHLRLNRFRQV